MHTAGTSEENDGRADICGKTRRDVGVCADGHTAGRETGRGGSDEGEEGEGEGRKSKRAAEDERRTVVVSLGGSRRRRAKKEEIVAVGRRAGGRGRARETQRELVML